MQLEKGQLIEMFRRMVKIRKFEEKVEDLSRKAILPGLHHLYIGEEAVAVGAISALCKEDLIISTHRGHGHCIAKGVDVKKMMVELFGKKLGCCRGKGGSMHISDIEIGMLGANGIVGSNISIAGGAALAAKLRKTSQVVVSFFGDGATNTGAFHEGINLASLWKVPAVFVCENNLYAISVAQSRATSVSDIADRATSYRIPGVTVDGMDVIGVYDVAHIAVERARNGNGPTLIECKTYRFRGHYDGEADRERTYRSKEEVQKWEKKCPIKNFRSRLIQMGILTEEELVGIEKKIATEIENAVKFAEESPYPEPEEALQDVYFVDNKK